MSAPKLLDVDDLRPLLLDIIDRMPDAVNPLDTGEMVCLYTDPNDHDRHCLIGQLAAEMGWSVPDAVEDGGATGVAREYGWPVTVEAAEFLGDAQSAADGLVLGEPRSWADIRPEVVAL